MEKIVQDKILLLAKAFKSVLYSDDKEFMNNMKNSNLKGDDIERYRFWEWPQGVGLYGLWKMYKYSNDKSYLQDLCVYYDERLIAGLPSKNINTTAPMLAMAYVYEETRNASYLEECISWAEWIVNELPRTSERGFQHITSDSINEGELWDDTLFMTVLFLAKMGQICNNDIYIEEAKYQFLLHTKYLQDKDTGLWYHGWTFMGNHNFSKAFWGRGNCWITLAIPEFISILPEEDSICKYLKGILVNQIEGLSKYQDISGMWHTLIDNSNSYLEASATCGFAAGILYSARLGIISNKYNTIAVNTLDSVLRLIDSDGFMHQVSYGTPMGRISADFYCNIPISIMPYGQALGMLYLIEILHLLKTK